MKESQGVHKRLKACVMTALFDTRRGDFEVGITKVELQAIGRFCNNLERFLEIKNITCSSNKQLQKYASYV